MMNDLEELKLNIYSDDNKMVEDMTEIDVRLMIDKTILKLFGILQANKIMYSLKKDNPFSYILKTYKK